MFTKSDKTTHHANIDSNKESKQGTFFSGKQTDATSSSPLFFGPVIQPKLTVSAPGDPYEMEADSVADAVVAAPASGALRHSSNGGQQQDEQLQRNEAEEEESIQLMPRGNDIYRQEDEEEEAIQAKTDDHISRQVEEEEEEPVQASALPGIGVFRQSMEEEEEMLQASPRHGAQVHFGSQIAGGQLSDDLPATGPATTDGLLQNKQSVQRKKSRGPPVPGQSFETQLNASKSGGDPLSPGVRGFMESRIGADFSNVRVHRDVRAQDMTQQISAKAFAHGNHIYFANGQFDDQSTSGRHLIAHELTHTVQQGASPRGPPAQSSQVQAKPRISRVQRSVIQTSRAPQLDAAVELAEAEQGKVIANDEGPDGKRVGWERLMEYFKTTFGEDKIVSSQNGVEGTVWKGHIEKKSMFMGQVPNQTKPSVKELRDALPSWCGIFAFWSLNKAGIPMPKWELGGAMIDLNAGYPPGHTPAARGYCISRRTIALRPCRPDGRTEQGQNGQW